MTPNSLDRYIEEQFTNGVYKDNIYFWHEDDIHGYMSNWYEAPFYVNAWPFNSVEQYMIYRKACIFNDLDTAYKIMITNDCKEQKNFGRIVKNFCSDVWDKKKIAVVMMGAALKFAANRDICGKLSLTSGYYLVEASPYDSVWGVGLSESMCANTPREDWPGQNLLGKILCFVRDEMLGV